VDVYVDRDGGDPDVVFGLYVFLVLGAYIVHIYIVSWKKFLILYSESCRA
jgi:hypothetical protein